MDKPLTPLQAVRRYCMQCCCDSSYEVRLCPSQSCPLYPFRLGHNPSRKMDLTEEQRKAAGERLRNARNADNSIAQQGVYVEQAEGEESAPFEDYPEEFTEPEPCPEWEA